MVNGDIKGSIQETITDLRNKATRIENYSNELNNPAIEEIKNKTIDALNMAIAKISKTAQSFPNNEELQVGLEFVKNKSDDLYENALSKINEIISENQTNDNVEETDEKITNLIEEALNGNISLQNTNQAINELMSSKEGASPIEDKIVETLKEWINPED